MSAEAEKKVKGALFFIMIGMCMLFYLKELTFTITLLSKEITFYLPRFIGILFIGSGVDIISRYGSQSLVASLSIITLGFCGAIIDAVASWPSNIYLRLLILAIYIVTFWLFIVFMGEVAKYRYLSVITTWQRRIALLSLCAYGLVMLFINLFKYLISPSEALFFLTQFPLFYCGFKTFCLLYRLIFIKNNIILCVLLSLTFWQPFAMQVHLALFPQALRAF